MKRNILRRYGRQLSRLALVFGVLLPVTASAQGVISYEQAMEIAMDNSPNIKRTILDLDRSKEMLNAQNAALKSGFRLSLNPFSYSRDKSFNRALSEWISSETKSSQGTFSITQPIKETDGTLSLNNNFSWQDSYSDYQGVTNNSFNNNLYFSYDQPIFTYNRTKLELKELELDLENTVLTFALQKLALEQQVANSFYTVYQNKLSVDIAREELENQQKSFEIIKNKVDAGLSALEEQYQAELNLATSQSNLHNRQVQLENSIDNFKLQVGIPLTETVTVDADVTHRFVEIDMDKAVNTALIHRIELRQLRINLENSQHNLIRTKALNEFKGSVELTYGIRGNDEKLGQIFDQPKNEQVVGIMFDIPLWDWGEKKSRIRASEATISSRKLSIEDERNSIIIGIRQSSRNINNLVLQIDIAEQSLRNAQLTYEINLERYANGDLTSMDLSLFQNQLSQRKTAIVQALISYKLAILDLKIQSLWDFEKNEPVIPEIVTGD